MSSSTFNADEEALRAELRKKERDLLLAARYGKGLLEENERIKKDLENVRQEHANAMEVSIKRTVSSYMLQRRAVFGNMACSIMLICGGRLWEHV